MISDINREQGKFLTTTRDTVTELGAQKSRLLPSGTLILSNSGSVCIQKILRVSACIHDGFVVFPEVTDHFEQEFLYYWFEYIRPQIIQENKQGFTQVNLNTAIVRNIPLPKPSLLEQKSIIGKLEELFSDLDAGIAALQRAKANLKRYRASVLKSAVEGKLTAQWREQNPPTETGAQLLARILKERRAKWEENQLNKFAEQGKTPPLNWEEKYPEPGKPDTSKFPRLPDGWMWVSLEQITERIADVDHKMPKSEQSDIRYISTKDFVSTDCIDFDNAKRISRDDYEALCKKIRPENGDILLSRYGTVGSVRLVNTSHEFQASYSIAIIKTLKKIETTPFIVATLRSDLVQWQIRRDVRATAQPDLGLAHIKIFGLPLPPYLEQQQILAEVDRRLSIADSTEKTLDHALARASRLRQAILKRAFEGRLVPQDPNDEPASVLLERIRTERDKQTRPTRLQKPSRSKPIPNPT